MGLGKAWNAAQISDTPVRSFLKNSLWEGTKGLGSNTVSSYTNAYHGDFMKFSSFSLLGAGIGAGAGAFGASMIPNGMDAGEGAIAGAAVGGLAPLALGTVGALGIGAMKHSGTIAKAVGSAASAGAGMVGMAGRAASKIGLADVGKELLKQNPISRYGNPMARAMGGILKYTPEKSHFDEAKGKIVTKRGRVGLTKRGLAAGGIVGGLSMAKGFLDDVYEGRSGAPTGVTRATPSYLDNAGASGDLVFAMHQNRRG